MMQSDLDTLYQNYLNRILSNKDILSSINNYELSSPQFIDVRTNKGMYENSDFKILFVGKQTNGWYNAKEREEDNISKLSQFNPEYVKCLRNIYFKHNLGENYRKPLFLFIDLLTQKFQKYVQSGFLLTELLRHDFKGGTIPPLFLKEITYNNNEILRKEIEILKPDTLIFLTGPSYDIHIKNTYPTSEFIKVENYKLNQVAIIENIPNIRRAIRIYHPDYHNRKGEDFKEDMANLIFELIDEVYKITAINKP